MAGPISPTAAMVQGVSGPPLVVAPELFFPATRRLKFSMRAPTAINALGSTDSTQLRQTGIVAALEVRVFGTVTFGGTITGTNMLADWPLNLVKSFKLSANGQSNLINARGLTVRALEFVSNPKLSDEGLDAQFNGTAVKSGSLKLATDDWGTSGVNGLNPGSTVAAAGTYAVDLTYFVPVAADPVSLVGAIYAQSSATNLSLDIDWAPQASLTTLGGAATFAQSLQYSVTGVAYSIPNVGGRFCIPDLTQFHQIVDNRQGGIVQGLNEPPLSGTGVGRKLLRAMFQVYSGSTPAPLPLNATNFDVVGWAYGGNDVPESYPNGQLLRASNLRVSGADLGGNHGLGLWDFCSQFALRDVVDEGSTADLRLQIGLKAAPTNGFAQIVQETLFAAPVGA